MNAAVTLFAALMATVQVLPEVESQPVQLAKVLPADGLAVRVTLVPELKGALHVLPQLMPVGDDVTVPEPVPDLTTLKVYCGIAVTVIVKDCVFVVTPDEVPVTDTDEEPAGAVVKAL